MDKNSYEFLPLNNGEEVPDQYFVVQDDGTLLNQLIPPEGESNIYNGSFLLQADSSFHTQQIVTAVINKPEIETEDVKIYVDPIENKQTSVFTEITLTDEQVHLLEQKGWILLETNDKIYVLNNMGLHDITDNDKLIQKLRNEIQNPSTTEASSSCTKNSQQYSSLTTFMQDLSSVPDIKLINDNNSIQQSMEEERDICYVVENQEPEMVEQMETNDSSVPESPEDNTNDQAAIGEPPGPELNSLKIKTKMSFKDIPDKILLGKTINGKNLYAKVKSCAKPIVIYEINENEKDNLVVDADMGRTQFLNLVYKLDGKIGDKVKLEENLSAARHAITEIFKIPNLRHYIIDQYLFITRITHKIDVTNNTHYKSEAYLLTGVVEMYDNKQWNFVYILNILDDILKDLILEDSELEPNEYNMQVSHIHIKEMKSTNNIVRISVTLAKQQLCFLSVSDKPRRRSPLHACGTCAAVFGSERELEVHQENQCTSTDGPLVIDAVSQESSTRYITILNRSGESYCCTQCNATFTKLSACEKHVTTHYFPSNVNKMDGDSSKSGQQTSSNTEGKDSSMKVYKCTMCPGTYFHSSTYSKHLISRHIKLQLKEITN